jgi:RNA polymerase sigma-70 factor (ECF subfamily)
METLAKSTDERLIELFASGNNEAFEMLLYRYKDRVYRYIFNITHWEELTDDIFQDTFIKAITTIKQGRYVDSGHFYTWVCRIAHNLVIDYFRKDDRQNVYSNDASEVDLFSNAALCEESIQDLIIQDDTAQQIMELVQQLPELQRKIVELRFFQQLSFKEIAEIENISINTALGRMRYAILNMRKEAQNIDLAVA